MERVKNFSTCLEVVGQGSDGRLHEKDELLADLLAVVLPQVLGCCVHYR